MKQIQLTRPQNMTESDDIRVQHIGMRLAQKRQAMGLSLDELAKITHLRAEYLQNIEALNVEALPSIGYVLGYIRTYAKALGLDGENAVSDYKLDVQVPENLGMRDAPHFVPKYKLQLPRGFVPALMTVSFAVMLGIWYGVQTETQAAEQSVADYNQSETESDAKPLTDADLITLRATAPSWVQVKDIDGAILISRIFVTGETWQGPKEARYRVSVRDAGAIDVYFGHKQSGVLGARGVALNDIDVMQNMAPLP